MNKKGEWVPYYKSFYADCKSRAEEKYEAYMRKHSAGQQEVSFSCLGEAMDAYLDTVFLKTALAYSTKDYYVQAYQGLLQGSYLSGRPLRDVTAMDLQRFYNELDAGFSRRKHLHDFVRHFYKYADLNGICSDITRSLVVPGEKRTTQDDFIEVWDDDDLNKVIATLEGKPLRLLVILAVQTGARISELLALTYDDIANKTLSINKQLYEKRGIGRSTGKALRIVPVKSRCSNRKIPISDDVMHEVEVHRELQNKLMRKYHYDCHGYLFTTSSGMLYYRQNIVRALQRHYKRVGVPYHRFHAYRHTFGTNLSRAGVPIEVTSKLMGHASIDVTAKYYINIETERRRDAIESIGIFTAQSIGTHKKLEIN